MKDQAAESWACAVRHTYGHMVVTHWVGLTLRKVRMVGTQEEGESGWRWVDRDPGAHHWAFVGNVCWSITFNNWLSGGGEALIYHMWIPFQATHMRSLTVELGKDVPNWFRKACGGQFQHTHWLWADAGVAFNSVLHLIFFMDVSPRHTSISVKTCQRN